MLDSSYEIVITRMR